MQHRRSDFNGQVSIKGLLKLDKIADEQRIRISNLAMASRRIIADYVDDCPWYCLSVRTGSEFTVEKYLYEENVEAFVPSWQTEPRYSRGRLIASQKRPVTPGYVLVQFAASPHAFLALSRVKHVQGFLGGAVKPYRIPLIQIEIFRQKAKSGAFNQRHVRNDYLRGEEVRITEGPFASFNATVTEVDKNKHRLKVEASIFGRSTPLELDIAQIEKV